MKTQDETESHEPILLSLKILRRLFRSHIHSEHAGQPANFHNAYNEIKMFLLNAIKHEYASITVEGMRVAGSFLNTLRSEATGAVDPKYAGISSEFYDNMLELLSNPQATGSVK